MELSSHNLNELEQLVYTGRLAIYKVLLAWQSYEWGYRDHRLCSDKYHDEWCSFFEESLDFLHDVQLDWDLFFDCVSQGCEMNPET